MTTALEKIYISLTKTTIVLQPFVRDYQGELVPEKNIHPSTILIIIQTLSASSIYYNP